MPLFRGLDLNSRAQTPDLFHHIGCPA